MQPIRQRQWKLRAAPVAQQQKDSLAETLNISPALAGILSQRGYRTPTEASVFLSPVLAHLPDPMLLPQMPEACRRLQQAITSGEKISIHGDYDVDGISGCALLVEGLSSFGGNLDYHIPLRLKDGYGLSAEAVREAAGRGCRVLVSVDCGVSAISEAQLAADLGIDLIITDHHQPGVELPVCTALVNPHLPTNRFPYTELAGVGVAFCLLVALRKLLRDNGHFSDRPEPDLRRLLDLVALGTIADIAPLTGVNRILVKSGLKLLQSGERPGIVELKRVAGTKNVTSGVVGFQLAPRLNAAGRLEDAALGVKLLLGEPGDDLGEIAEQLDHFNQERRAIETQVLDDAIRQLEHLQNASKNSIVLGADNWHSGVIGIVASRLVERYYRPTFLVAFDGAVGKGSGRSIAGCHLHQALQECADSLLGFGGHAMAAGLSLERRRFPHFAERFDQAVAARLTAENRTPTLLYDDACDLDLWTIGLVRELDSLGPFGAGNPQPVYLGGGCRISDARMIAGKHVRLQIEQGTVRCGAIAFGFGERFDEFAGRVDVLYRPALNQWQGRAEVQLEIVDIRATES